MPLDPFNQKPATPKKRQTSTDGFFEALRDIGGGVASGIKNDLIRDSAKAATNTILNTNAFKASGDIAPGKSLDMEQMHSEVLQQEEVILQSVLVQVSL